MSEYNLIECDQCGKKEKGQPSNWFHVEKGSSELRISMEDVSRKWLWDFCGYLCALQWFDERVHEND